MLSYYFLNYHKAEEVMTLKLYLEIKMDFLEKHKATLVALST